MQLSRGKTRTGVLLGSLLAAFLAVLILGAAGAAAKTPKVLVADDYFAPATVTIKQRNKVKFVWDQMNINTHNVTLTKGPKKVKKRDFTSRSGAIGIKFAPKFKKKGTYKFICTIHPVVMQATVKVKAAKKKGKKGKRKKGKRGKRR